MGRVRSLRINLILELLLRSWVCGCREEAGGLEEFESVKMVEGATEERNTLP